jgi:hypothetical protein
MVVVFTGASDKQVQFSGGSDPRKYLIVGQKYTVDKMDIHSWHTRYYLAGFNGIWFSSVCFREVVDNSNKPVLEESENMAVKTMSEWLEDRIPKLAISCAKAQHEYDLAKNDMMALASGQPTSNTNTRRYCEWRGLQPRK